MVIELENHGPSSQWVGMVGGDAEEDQVNEEQLSQNKPVKDTVGKGEVGGRTPHSTSHCTGAL